MSISIYAGKYTSKDCVEMVFTREETTQTFYNDIYDVEDEGTPNPNYRPEFDINFATANARMILAAIGVDLGEDEFFSLNVDEMINRCTSYLKRNVGKKSPAIQTVVDQEPGKMTMIHCGVDEGYIERNILRIATLAREGKARGAEVIYGG